jgi:hypothetical protein
MFKIGDKVKIKYVEHKQYKCLVGKVGVIEEIYPVSWCGANCIVVFFKDIVEFYKRMGWKPEQLELK